MVEKLPKQVEFGVESQDPKISLKELARRICNGLTTGSKQVENQLNQGLKNRTGNQTNFQPHLPRKPQAEKELNRTEAATRQGNSQRHPVLRMVWSPELGWLGWNPETQDHDVPLEDEHQIEEHYLADERDAIQDLS